MKRASGRIVITGAAGFIGSHLAATLLERGNSVLGIDNFDSGYDRGMKRRNVALLESAPLFSFFEADVRDREAIARAVFDFAPGLLYHLAARVGSAACLGDPATAREINVNGSGAVAEICREGAIDLVAASSASVYSGSSSAFCREEQELLPSANPYIASKQSAERVVMNAQSSGSCVSVIRLASTFGPRQRPGTGFEKFASRLLRGESVTVYDAPVAKREFLFISDAVEAFILAGSVSGQGGVFNVGSGSAMRMDRVAEVLAAALGTPLKIDLVPAPAEYYQIPLMSSDRARDLLGFRPAVALEAGIRLYADWYKRFKQGDL